MWRGTSGFKPDVVYSKVAAVKSLLGQREGRFSNKNVNVSSGGEIKMWLLN